MTAARDGRRVNSRTAWRTWLVADPAPEAEADASHAVHQVCMAHHRRATCASKLGQDAGHHVEHGQQCLKRVALPIGQRAVKLLELTGPVREQAVQLGSKTDAPHRLFSRPEP